jgi:hypothetical protein
MQALRKKWFISLQKKSTEHQETGCLMADATLATCIYNLPDLASYVFVFTLFDLSISSEHLRFGGEEW